MSARLLRTLAVAGLSLLVATCAAVGFIAAPGASANVTPGVVPDIVLSASSTTFTKHYDTLLINDATPQADPSVVPTPDQCRDIAALDVFCDVYRFKIVRDTSKGASNFVVVTVDWKGQASTPALALAVAGLSDSDVPDIDLFLYKDADTYIDYADVGGRGAVIPERIVWEATQGEYDLVVRAGTGVATEYRITAQLSNEVFGKPFEVLDLSQTSTGAAPPDFSQEPPAFTIPGAPVAPELALAPVEADEDISQIGLGTDEQFGAQDLNLGKHTRAVATAAEPPSTLVLILAMVFFPATAASGAFVVLRRRRDALAG
jgi:hypothetical protein